MIERAIVRRKVDIVSLDPFVKTHGVSENDNNLIDQVTQVLLDLSATYDIAVDTPHHVRKGPSDPGNADRARGASSQKDAYRLVYTLSTMSPEEAETFGIPEEERHSYVRMDKGKVNIIPPARKAQWFKIVGIRLENATELYPDGDEVQTVEPWVPPAAFDGLDTRTCNRILDVIDAGLPDGERYSSAPRATNRAAWQAVERQTPGKPEISMPGDHQAVARKRASDRGDLLQQKGPKERRRIARRQRQTARSEDGLLKSSFKVKT